MTQQKAADYFKDTLDCFEQATSRTANMVPIHILHADSFQSWLQQRKDHGVMSQRCQQYRFSAQPGELLLIPDEETGLLALLLGSETEDISSVADWWDRIPAGSYYLARHSAHDINFCLAWARASYDYRRHLSDVKGADKRLYLPQQCKSQAITLARVEYAVCDLINAPCNWMDPSELSEVTKALADHFKGTFKETVGAELVEKNYPAIYAVGKASHVPPRLLEFNWGDEAAPLLVLVGKGVCFDSGGLNLKPTSGIRWMKKDMAGAAHVLGLAYLIMQAKLPLRLQVLIPAVENAVGSDAYRPGDILRMRSGLRVEVSNTDAEGRLVLADAMSLAVENKPDLLIDIATLTGAARVAVGPDIIPFFASNDDLMHAVAETSFADECLFSMPLYRPYQRYLKSGVADLKNAAEEGGAGAITAALFLQHFAGSGNWLHFDIFAWQGGGKLARVQAIYSLFQYLSARYR